MPRMISQRWRYLIKWPKMKFHFAMILNQFAVERVKWWVKIFQIKEKGDYFKQTNVDWWINKQCPIYMKKAVSKNYFITRYCHWKNTDLWHYKKWGEVYTNTSYIYDSLTNRSVPLDVAKQIAAFFIFFWVGRHSYRGFAGTATNKLRWLRFIWNCFCN